MERIERVGGPVSVAAVNGPASVVVSGDADALERVDGGRVRRGVSGASDPGGLCVAFGAGGGDSGAVAGGVGAGVAAAGGGAVVFDGDPGLVDTAGLDAEYWFRNLRETVEFERDMQVLLADGFRVFVEVSPHPVVWWGCEETVEDAGVDAVVVASLRRDEGGLGRFFGGG